MSFAFALPLDPRPWLASASLPTSVRALRPADEVRDGELVERARRGDRWAEEALYRRHVRYIAGIATRLLGRHHESEDVVQETFAIALEQLGSLRDGDAFRSWLAHIAVSQAQRRFRRRRLLRTFGLDHGGDDARLESLASPDASPEVRAELAALDNVLAALPADVRLAWMLRRVEGWSLDEVSEACRCSLATTKRRIAAAEAKVAAFVNIAEGEP